MLNDFLPDDYAIPKGSNRYFKFVDGPNRIRILSTPTIGWEYWNTDPKPKSIRFLGKTPPEVKLSDIKPDQNGKRTLKHFWVFSVWDYSDDTLKIASITQKTVIEALYGLIKDKGWGDPTGYDITITRKKEGDKISYSLLPSIPSGVTEDMITAIADCNIDMAAYIAGENPFKGN